MLSLRHKKAGERSPALFSLFLSSGYPPFYVSDHQLDNEPLHGSSFPDCLHFDCHPNFSRYVVEYDFTRFFEIIVHIVFLPPAVSGAGPGWVRLLS